MPAPKRQLPNPSQDSSAKKSRVDKSRDEVSKENGAIIKLLKECSTKQRDLIFCLNRFLASKDARFKRLRLHLQYHQLTVEKKRNRVRSRIMKKISAREKKISEYNTQTMMENIDVEKMKKQEESLEKIVQDSVKYKNYRLQIAEKIVRSEPHPYGPYEQELKDALLNIPSTFRDDGEIAAVPKLQKTDLDKIEWPSLTHSWRQFSIHWNSEFEEAAECRKLNEKINVLKEKLAEVRSIYEEARAKKDRIKLYDENRNCPTHGKTIRDSERTELTEQLDQLIRKSFEKKASLEKLRTEKRLLDESKQERENLLNSIQERINSESLKCSVCFYALTNGEQSLRCPQTFGSCGHAACATCMQQFKAANSPYHWKCPQCRQLSDKVLTNWTLMEMIKEIPGQPQRVLVDAPQAVPIVPAPWRLEQRERRLEQREEPREEPRREPEPNHHDQGIVDYMNRVVERHGFEEGHRRLFEDFMGRPFVPRANREPQAAVEDDEAPEAQPAVQIEDGIEYIVLD